MLERASEGLYCPAGDFYIDPWQPVPRAVLTHMHGDHARRGCGRYLVAREGQALARLRLGSESQIDVLEYGHEVVVRGVRISLLPAGHIHGSAQVCVEHRGERWVVSGDYKTHADPTCAPLEAVRCHGFVTEATFGLPVYRWPDPAGIFEEIHAWWRGNQESGKASVLYGYALGKAQRLLAGLDASVGPIFVHGAVLRINQAYQADGVALAPFRHAGASVASSQWRRALIVAPPWVHGTAWLRRFFPYSTAMVSGWMRIRGTRRRRTLDRGFVLSDHADWPGLMEVIRATGATTVWTTHGYSGVVSRKLSEAGIASQVVDTQFRGETLEESGVEDPELETSESAAGSDQSQDEAM